ncbi:nitroreductase family protein [Carboxylicivirga marina]|uniref:Nitroreductase family protein n=1 Tax=Carboxylicivirga marina TaxID=2800988 RepID=A0ABS1HN54_9BACT|nr:nitroreductase family protein [Carboxylicivirga marina]MBK3519061.1 nitroreductase family protein [Carboxylicivirga marina]
MHFNQLLRERYSIREYKPLKVSKALVIEVLEAGRMAPSAANKQPWNFILVSDENNLKTLKSAYDREWFKNVPQMIVVCGNHNESWKRSTDQKDHCDVDAAIAIDHMTLRATELGLGTCWVCHFDPAIVRESLQLPQHIEPIALLPIGYPVDNGNPAKVRKAFSEVAFEEVFGSPLKK